MWTSLIALLVIQIVVVFCIDLSGGGDSLSSAIWRCVVSKKAKKPDGWRAPLFGCSLCSTWWASLLYLVCSSSLSWCTLAAAALLSYFTPVCASFIALLKDASISLIDKLYKHLIN